jgi:tRNA pseudouridine55 synthase
MPVPSPAAALDGAIVVDKPGGMTSHDVVASVRRALAVARVGHTGTLDPMATGVLPLLVGRATRLAQFLAGADKTYEARVRFGWATTTYDALGEPTSAARPVRLDPAALADALARFEGDFEQVPPAYSAKKVDGKRAYDLARARKAPDLAPVRVTVRRLETLAIEEDAVVLRLTCSAGFYVRSLAHDLGSALGTGAHLAALRRTASGTFRIADAVGLGDLLREPAAAARVLVPMASVVAVMPEVRLDEAGVERVRRGQDVAGPGLPAGAPHARLLTPGGELAAIAAPAGVPGVLHPVVVLM